MNSPRWIRFAGAMLLAATVTAPVAMAQTPEESLFEVTEPTIVGDVTLQPGQYMISVIPSLADRHRVTVTDVNKTKVYTTVLTVPHELEPNERVPEARMVFYPAGGGEARALRTWFPRNAPREVGHDIVYEESRAKMLAQRARTNVVTYSGTMNETTTPEIRVVTPESTFSTYEAPRTTMTTQTRTETSRTELPRTAGNNSLVALLGALAIAGAVAFRAFNR